jgi:hypothetical protein
MKKFLTVVFTMSLASSLSFAQATGGSTDKDSGTSGKTTKSHKGGKKGKKGSGGTTTPAPK